MNARISNTNWPALNWLIHVLAEDVGQVEWVRMTEKEQETYDKEHPHNAGYPFKVVRHPIPKGKTIVLKEDGKTVIDCDSESTRDLIIHLAIEYINIESDRRRLQQEKRYDTWHKIEDLPPHSPVSSAPDHYTCLVYSPILPYVNGGVTMGFRAKGKWYIVINGKEIEHPVTHYRSLPPNPVPTVDYKTVETEVNKLRVILGYRNE